MHDCLNKSLKKLLQVLIYIYVLFASNTSGSVQMRVVKEIANFGYFGANVGEMDNLNQLVPSVPPSNFSGPLLFQKLVGKCFNYTEDRYHYLLCPFQNFTQYENSNRWNAYQGILGVWSHWEIVNNVFSAFMFKNGDTCGEINRSVKVSLGCGARNKLLNVTEPSRCEYEATFETRYACHKDALLVYPRLHPSLREDWDHLQKDLHFGLITQKGYDRGLSQIFKKAGFSEMEKSFENKTEVSIAPESFVELLSCNKEYKALQAEVSKLHAELEALKVIQDIQRVHGKTQKPL